MLGVHVCKDSKVLNDKTPTNDISEAITRDLDALNLNCAQIFTHGPRFIKKNSINVDAVINATKNIELSVHSAYPTVSIWKYNDTNFDSPLAKKALNALLMQLSACNEVHADKLVVHLSRVHYANAANTMKMIMPYVIKTKVKLILEMPASTADSDKTYETPEKINNLNTLIRENTLKKYVNSAIPNNTLFKWYGWCIDTAHLWGAGVNIKSYESMSNWLSSIKHKSSIVMFHLNGSSAKLASGKDKHEIAFSPDDLIWYKVKPEESGVRAICEFATKFDIPIICEINRGTEANVKKSLAVIKSLLLI